LSHGCCFDLLIAFAKKMGAYKAPLVSNAGGGI
jgi:hypothetical protein